MLAVVFFVVAFIVFFLSAVCFSALRLSVCWRLWCWPLAYIGIEKYSIAEKECQHIFFTNTYRKGTTPAAPVVLCRPVTVAAVGLCHLFALCDIGGAVMVFLPPVSLSYSGSRFTTLTPPNFRSAGLIPCTPILFVTISPAKIYWLSALR